MSSDYFFMRVKKHPRPVVIDFWAPWCGPCHAIEPVIKKLSAEYAGRVDIWKVNADEQSDLLRSLRIYGIPTLIAYHNGQEVARRTGVASQEALSALFEAALSGDKPIRSGRAPLDRFLRLAAGTAIFILGIQGNFTGYNLLLAGLGAVIAFSAIYDRCPVYRAVSSRLSAWLRKGSNNQSHT